MTSTSSGPGQSSRYVVPALRRGLEILQLFGRSPRPLGLAEACARTAHPQGHGLPSHSHAGRDGLPDQSGERLLSRAGRAQPGVRVPEIAGPGRGRPALPRGDSPSSSASAHLGVFDPTDVVYLCSLTADPFLASNVRVGARLPAHGTAMGRVLLSDLSKSQLRACYSGRPLESFTPKTITSLDELDRLLQEDRERELRHSPVGLCHRHCRDCGTGEGRAGKDGRCDQHLGLGAGPCLSGTRRPRRRISSCRRHGPFLTNLAARWPDAPPLIRDRAPAATGRSRETPGRWPRPLHRLSGRAPPRARRPRSSPGIRRSVQRPGRRKDSRRREVW